jgi:hypothetical protein
MTRRVVPKINWPLARVSVVGKADAPCAVFAVIKARTAVVAEEHLAAGTLRCPHGAARGTDRLGSSTGRRTVRQGA